MNKKMTVGSLFAGIGGIDLGLEMTGGFITEWQVEIDDYATRVLEKNWPDARRWRDVADFITDARRRPDNFRVDVLCGGPPCQAVSIAGSRRGERDDRWLWDSFRDVIEIIEPRYVVVENVRGLFSAKTSSGRRGGMLGGILRDLDYLGYDAEWGCIPACAFDLPHLRERLFLVASDSTGSRCEQTDADADCNRVRKQPRRRSGESGTGEAQFGFKCEEGITADTSVEGLPQRQQQTNGQATLRYEGKTVAEGSWRTIEPTVCRGDAVVPNRVDRIRTLGNSVCPLVAQWLGEQILRFDREQNYDSTRSV